MVKIKVVKMKSGDKWSKLNVVTSGWNKKRSKLKMGKIKNC